MNPFHFLIASAILAAGAALGQPSGEAPIARNPKVELKGRIQKIQVAQGRGMPYMEVKTADRTATVILGSVRYLMEQDFNPKAGDEVAVAGYEVNDQVFAISVTLISTGKVLKLRDADGRPVWMRSRRGGPPGRSSQ